MQKVFFIYLVAVSRVSPSWCKPQERNILPKQHVGYSVADVNATKIQPKPLLQNRAIDPQKITFNFVIGPNRNYLQLRGYEIDQLKTAKTFNPQLPMVLIIHGWQDSVYGNFSDIVSKAFLDNYSLNIFNVDWSPYAGNTDYFQASDDCPAVGEIVGTFLLKLEQRYETYSKDVTIVGHSLGAHVAGSAGRKLLKEGSKVRQIIGLDPAGFGYPKVTSDKCLNKNDADYVEIIHTNDLFLGLPYAIGHADFYPNGGLKQPMCLFDITNECSHRMAYIYYAESLVQSIYGACACLSPWDAVEGKCKRSSTVQVMMGGYDKVNKIASGNYILKTNNIAPYGKGTATCWN